MGYPFILYDNLYEDGTISATSTASGYSTSNAIDRLTFTRWKAGGTGAINFDVDLGVGNTQGCDALAISGHNLTTVGATVALWRSSDGVAWGGGVSATPQPSEFSIDETFIWGSTTSGNYRYWRVTFDLGSAAYQVGALCLGKKLEFTEAMTQGFDPDSLTLESTHVMSRNGLYMGQVVSHLTRRVKLRFGPAGLSKTAFFDVTTNPSWQHFLKTCWSRGRPFWFCWDGEPSASKDNMWYCWPPKGAKSGAPFLTAIRRGWTFEFDTLVEGYMTT